MMDMHSFYLDLIDNLNDGVYFTDLKQQIQFWNKGAERITGFQRDEVLGRRCSDNILRHIDDAGCPICLRGCPLAAVARNGNPLEAEFMLHHKNGHRILVRTRVSPLRNADGETVGAVEIFSDISHKKRMEERVVEMERLALVDSLTGLSNRRHMETHLQARLEELRRFNWPCGCLFIDIDNFKSINDQYGHEVGDRVLKMVAQTIQANTRYAEQAGRWGGEEFIVSTVGSNVEGIHIAAERFRILVENSFLHEPECIRATISVGCAIGLPDDTVDSLVGRADKKLYQAKQSGRNRVSI